MNELHQYVLSPLEVSVAFPDEVCRDVIASGAFRRLKSIRFLGAIDYIIPPRSRLQSNKRHTRYQHSLAVGSLAQRYTKIRGINGKDRLYCIVAALLHDIGHAPLSHSLESVFRSQFEIDHHKSGERIIRGEEKIGESLAQTLSRWDINNFRILSIIAGLDEPKFNEIFSHQINVDTIEAILRSRTYLHKGDSQITAPRVLDALVIRDKNAAEVLDAFWMIKNEIYHKLIQSKTGLMADYLCKRYMEINSKDFRESYYYGTEDELKRDHGRLFDILEEFGRSYHIPGDLVRDGDSINCTLRSFKIDPEVKITDISSIDRRYLQEKRAVEFIINKGRYEECHVEQSAFESSQLF